MSLILELWYSKEKELSTKDYITKDYITQKIILLSGLSFGGAQAIAAMAFGTETIPRVDKITGPGNIIEIHKDELIADWQLAVEGQQPFKIEPLK
ncbi:MAG TPA: hypothetical protein DDX84_11740 [Nitrospiraceae bacterium]|nr:MAG: hypothetical protein A3D21_08090 [Nitrospirae bacterium RIFCSPHIGHO2_02_FULL_42_12]HBI24842.1 hypothetical protein [Nitrospiraceae bacterium]